MPVRDWFCEIQAGSLSVLSDFAGHIEGLVKYKDCLCAEMCSTETGCSVQAYFYRCSINVWEVTCVTRYSVNVLRDVLQIRLVVKTFGKSL